MRKQILGVVCALGMLPTMASASDILEGFSHSVPLSVALWEIVPPGYTVSYGPGVDQSASVSWQGGKDWHTVMDEVASSHHLAVSYGNKSVRLTVDSPVQSPVEQSIGKNPDNNVGFQMVPYRAAPTQTAAASAPQAPQTTKVAEFTSPNAKEALDSRPLGKDSGEALGPQTRTAPVEPVTSQQLWHVSANQTVDQILSDWAAKAGWKEVYKSKMVYGTVADADFSGDFVTAASHFIESIKLTPKLYVVFYEGNHTFIVSNNLMQAN